MKDLQEKTRSRREKKLKPGDIVSFIGERDWVWVDAVSFEDDSDGDDPMFTWDRLETFGTVVSALMYDGCFCYVKLLVGDKIGYYYADQLRIVG